MLRYFFALILLCPCSLPAQEQFTADRLWQLLRLASFEVSPDGRTVAVAITAFDVEADRSSTSIWLFDLHGRRQPRLLDTGSGSASQPAWHPDGRHLFFLRTEPEQATQLYRQAIGNGPAQPLTALPVSVRRYRVVADGGAVIFEAPTWPDLNADFERVRIRQDEHKADKTQAKISETRVLRYWDSYLTDGMVPHLFRLDAESGAIVDLLPGFDRITGFERFDWDAATDGSRIVYSANATQAPFRELNFDLFLRELADGQERNLTANNPADDVRPVFSPDGRRIAYGRHRRPATGSDFRQLAMIDLDTGTDTVLAGNLHSHATSWRFGQDGKRILFHSERHGRHNLYQWRDGRVRRLAGGGSTESAQPAGRGIVYARHDFRSPPDLWLLEPGQEPRRITALNDTRMAEIRHGRYASVDYTGADGVRLHMWVAYPPGWRRGERYPAVILNHGGPFSSWSESFSFRWHPGLIAAEGYLVALPNFRGSLGFGQEFADTILGNHGELPAADTLAAADWLIENADADAQRLALVGGSYGGYLTTLLTGISDRFRAAVVHAGVYDLGQQFASDQHWGRPAAYGAAPWTDPVRLNAWSPSRFVPQMNTPTLILHGEVDYRVPVSQGINLHGALSGKGVPTRIVIFPHENHWILRPQAARLWWRETLDWLQRWNPTGDEQGAS